MTAIYKRELRSYLTSMIGYLFIFFILLLTGIYFSAYQLDAAYPKFEYTLSALTFVFLISVPILTMKILAEERKQKTAHAPNFANYYHVQAQTRLHHSLPLFQRKKHTVLKTHGPIQCDLRIRLPLSSLTHIPLI